MTSAAMSRVCSGHRGAAIEIAAQEGDEQSLKRGDPQRRKQTAGKHRHDVGPEDAEEVLAAIDAGPEQDAEEVDVEQEDGEEQGKRGSLGGEDGEQPQGLRGEDLVIAAVGKERVPLEDHDEAHHDHGERDENVTDRDQAPAEQGQGAEEEHEERAGRGQDAEGLDDAGLGFALGRKRFLVEESPEEVSHQRAEDIENSRLPAVFHVNLDTALGN